MVMIRVPDNTRKEVEHDPRPSNIYWNGNKWYISQVIHGNREYYGTYKTLTEATEKRNQLAQQGIIKERRGQHRIRNHKDRYIYEYHGRYYLKKVVNKKQQHFGVFNTLEEAREERDYLESINWDYSNMDNGVMKWGGYEYDETR